MDWNFIITEIGGGLSAVSLVALAFAWWTERRDRNAAMTRALEREREHSRELVEILRTVDTISRALERSG